MTWNEIVGGIVMCVCALWTFWRTEDQFQAGYAKALDHVDEMTRFRRFGLRVALTGQEAVKKLRAESSKSRKGVANRPLNRLIAEACNGDCRCACCERVRDVFMPVPYIGEETKR